jgi:hypothetical protein
VTTRVGWPVKRTAKAPALAAAAAAAAAAPTAASTTAAAAATAAATALAAQVAAKAGVEAERAAMAAARNLAAVDIAGQGSRGPGATLDRPRPYDRGAAECRAGADPWCIAAACWCLKHACANADLPTVPAPALTSPLLMPETLGLRANSCMPFVAV